MFSHYQEEEEILVLDEVSTGQTAHIIVYNDEYNTFDWVAKCFMEILGHVETQAEQLSLIIHFKGKATVKSGCFDEMKPLKDALVDRGLSAVIETEEVGS